MSQARVYIEEHEPDLIEEVRDGPSDEDDGFAAGCKSLPDYTAVQKLKSLAAKAKLKAASRIVELPARVTVLDSLVVEGPDRRSGGPVVEQAPRNPAEDVALPAHRRRDTRAVPAEF